MQYAPGLFRHLKVAVEGKRNRHGQYLLTGSQKFTLDEKRVGVIGRAGRYCRTWRHFLWLKSWRLRHKPDWKPPLCAAASRNCTPIPEIDAVAYYNSYLATYLERDVRSLANVGSLRDFERFLRACALRSANLLNKADLARDIGIAPSTANQWLSMLEASGQVVLLEPWFSNRTKSLVKSPKLYLADTGLLCALLNIRSEEALADSPWAGAVWETFVLLS